MAEKGFGVKEINLIGASGTPTIESPNNLNLNAINVAISTNVSIGGTLSVTGNVSVGGTLTYEDVTNIDSVGLITARSGVVVGAGKSILVGAGVTISSSTKGDIQISGIATAQRFDAPYTGAGSGFSMEGGAYNNGFYINNGSGNTLLGMAYFSNNTIGLSGNGSSPLAFIIDDVSTISLNPSSGACNLNYAGSGKLQTTNTGINVTGAITVNNSALSIDPTNSDIQVVYAVTANGASAYRFAGNGVVSTADNPDLYLIRGQKYRFINNSGGSHPFQIREVSGGTAYSTGVTNNGASSGNIDFAPTYDSPAQLVYQCTSHSGMVGNIYLRDAAGNNTNVGVVTATAFIPTQGQLSHRNVIVNGAMNVAQRGTQSTSDGIETVDRFGIGFATGAIQQDQITLTSSDTPYAYGFRKSYRLTNTTASTAVTAARDIRYQIEAQDIATSGWDSTSSSSEITISFWVKASVSQTYYVFHYVPDSQKNYNWNFTPAANTWTKITKTIPGASGVTINNDNGPGMSIQIVAYYGNNFTASTDPTQNQWFTWSGTNRIPNMTNTWGGTTNATFEVTGMQLEVGPVATPFEHRSAGEELQRCQRYYIKDTMIREGSGYGVVTGSLDSLVGIQVDFPVTMRDTPSLSLLGSTYRTGGSANAERISPTGFIWGRKQTGSGTFNGAAYATGGYEVSAEF